MSAAQLERRAVEIAYFETVHTIRNSRLLRLMGYIPWSEVKAYLDVDALIGDGNMTENTARYEVATYRLTNRFCHYCHRGTRLFGLIECPNCQMAFYCDEDCRAKHFKVHERWCCTPEGPPDDGWAQTLPRAIIVEATRYYLRQKTGGAVRVKLPNPHPQCEVERMLRKYAQSRLVSAKVTIL